MIEVVGAILIREGQLLLGLRAPHKSYPGCWDVFGGHLEAGESPWEALCRELSEELDLTLVAGAPLEVIRFDHPSEGPSLLHIFRVEAWNGEARIADDEHTELRWFTAEEAQALCNLADPEYRSLFARLALPAGGR
jgi:8-oxo-dGTP pyrophosphatase MutT (NUDIX family)